AREVGVAGARPGDLLTGRRRRPGIHGLAPVLEIAVADAEREWGPRGAAAPEAGQHLDCVLLDLHAPAAAVAHLAPRKVAVDGRTVELEPGRQAIQDGDQRGSVRLASAQVTQTGHGRLLLAERPGAIEDARGD